MKLVCLHGARVQVLHSQAQRAKSEVCLAHFITVQFVFQMLWSETAGGDPFVSRVPQLEIGVVWTDSDNKPVFSMARHFAVFRQSKGAHFCYALSIIM